MKELFHKILFVGRYAIVGGIGGLIQTATLYVWVDILGLTHVYLLGAMLGFSIALAVTFLLQKFWTFRGKASQRTKREFMFYTAFALGSLLATMLLLELARMALRSVGKDFFDHWYLAAQIAITLLLALVSFFLNYAYTFNVQAETTQEIEGVERA